MELVVKKSPNTTLRSSSTTKSSSSESSASASATVTDGNSNPFQRHDVQEWSRLDSITGMIEHARLQRDHWTANTHNSTQQYGKIIDSRDKSAADGNIQQRHRKQLEVFQTQTPGGSLQVIRTQTITSSSSRWSSSNVTSSTSSNTGGASTVLGSDLRQLISDKDGSDTTRTISQDFENLQLALNPLDLSSQKSKASVGRSGSIGGRRPPSRPRSYIGSKTDNTLQQTLNTISSTSSTSTPSTISNKHFENDVESSLERVSEICQKIHEETLSQNNILNGFAAKTHVETSRTKSNSIENLDNIDTNSEDNYLEDWKRSAKIRRSLQITKLGEQTHSPQSQKRILDLPNNTGNVNKIKQELEKGRRLNTALRGTNVDLDALDQILKSISPVINSDKFEPPEKDTAHTGGYIKENKPVLSKRSSFITAESLQEVRGRLRRLSSPINYVYKDFETPIKQEPEPDDGIVAEENLKIDETSSASSRVRSYVFGMETAMINGRKTGSLESRTSSKNNNLSGNRTEDWYNRRKSYGFEQMHNQNDCNGLQSKVESSTDSGICRSTEITILPSTLKSEANVIRNNKSTVVNLTSTKRNEHVDPFSSRKAQEELNTVWNKIASMKIGNNHQSTERESITIRIPIKSDTETVNSTKIHLNSDHELKRHSIAVDESKYVIQNERFPHLRRTSLAIPDNREYFTDNTDDDFNQHGRKTKKVEFCKTEVHFAAESGRVNIVETDGKPPPTQNFRRRRRNSGGNQTLLIEDSSRNNNGLPLTHFGDIDSDKKIFYGKEIDEKYPKTFEPIEVWDKYISNTPIKNGVDYEEEQKDSSENENTPKGILKNKPIKPKPYHLGENIEITNNSSNSTPWGVRLKPVHSSSDEAVTSTPPMWHSTVVVKNPNFKNIEEETNLTKFQKEFKQFKSSNQHQVVSSLSDDNSSDNNNCVRRPSWSVADRIKQVEDMKWTENKGYSTKINFGEIGEATIVNQNMENNNRTSQALETNATWQNHHDISSLDEMKSMPVINKALVVRFGKKAEPNNNNNEHVTKYIENTKSNIINNNTSHNKTTKIDSTPLRKSPIVFNNMKLPRVTLHSLKSTSLIMNTIQQSKQQQQQEIPTTVVPNYQKSQTSDSISSESYHSISSTTTTDDFIIPKQLEALKKLYEDAGELSDDSERADEEVRSYMSADTEDNDKVVPVLATPSLHDDTSSVLSGSWSKMRAIQMSQTYKKLKSDLKPAITQTNNNSNNNSHNNNNNNCSLNAILTTDNCDKKYVENNRESVNQRWTKFTSKELSNNNSTSNTYENMKNTPKQVSTNNIRSYTIPTTEKFDGPPSSTKRHYPVKISAQKYYENTNNLTSPSLVGLQSTTQATQTTQTTRTETNNKYFVTNGRTFEQNLRKYPSEKLQNYNEIITERKSSKELNIRRSQSPTKEITYLNRRNSNKSNMTRRSSSPANNGIRETVRLRPVPTYFGAIRSPRTPRKYSEKVNVLEKSETNNSLLTNKPDLLCHNSISTRIGSDIKTKVIKEINEDKLRRDSPIPDSEKLPSPIYENLEEIKSNKYSSRTSETIENETAILEELTRAADQILLAVNGYTDEESLKISTEDDDDDIKRKRGYERKTADVLGTISETKSWSQKTKVSEKSSVSSKVTQSTRLTKSRTPSTSSIDSINTNNKTKIVEKKEIDERHKRRSSNESSVKTTTRARRLQRASSREALLQSHGSSSEDIATPIVPARKPRATRRVKSAENKEQNNSSLNSNLQAKRRTSSSQVSRTSSSKKEVDVVKKDRHSVTTGLPEIRHKTAVSTIRSSAEKQAEKDKLRRSEENRKRVSSRRDPQGSTSSSRLRSNHPMSYRSTDGHGSTYGTTNSHGIQTVPVERITTTNGNVLLNRRCSRNEALSRH